MRLSEIYMKEVVLRDFWKQVQEDLTLNEEADETLLDLINQSNELIFDKFKVNPKEKVYSIVGSARLYLYPTLRKAFDLEGSIGDLDLVFPRKQDWINGGLEKNWNEGGLYRPTDDIEAFNVWDPSKAGGAYADVSVRPTSDIIKDSSMINGYYFMSLEDIMDYKTKLDRDKENEIVDVIKQYSTSKIDDRKAFIIRIVRAIGVPKAKEFLGIMKK